MENQLVISNMNQWEQIEAKFVNAQLIGLDTEFMREKSYYPKLCLVQLSNGKSQVCLDAIAFDIREILTTLFSNEDIQFVAHSTSQDLEVINVYCDQQISNLFDTQLAAEFCGFTPQIGYATLVEELIDVQLEKSHTRADWTKRPLSKAQIEYCIHDVEFLIPMYHQLCEMLRQKNRMDWFVEEQQAEIKNINDTFNVIENAHERLKSASKYSARKQQVIKMLANWRENQAQKENKPRNWIINDKLIHEIVKALPENRESIDGYLLDNFKIKIKYIKAITESIIDGLNQPNEFVYKKADYIDKDKKTQLTKLRNLIKEKSLKLNIPATRIATRSDIEQFLIHKNGKLSHGWRSGLQLINSN